MTIAIDDWSTRQGGEKSDDALDHDEVLESDMHADAVKQGVGASDSALEDEALAIKKAKDMKIMKIAGGVVLVMSLGVGGLLAVGGPRGNGQAEQQVAPDQGQVLAQAPVTQVAPPVELTTAQPIVAQQVAPVALELSNATATATATATAPAPVGVVPASHQPALAAAALVQPAGSGIAVATPAAPVAPAIAAATVVAPAALSVQPVQAAAAVVVPESESKATAALRSDIKALRAEFQNVRSELAGKDRLIADLRKQAVPVEHVQRVAVAKKAPVEVIITEPRTSREATLVAAKASVSKVAVDQKPVVIVDPQVVAETRQTMVSPPASAKGGKVRSEFTVYAVSNGRAWLTWGKDGMNYTVGANSELPDYSKVLSIDDVRGIVFTSAGEVHPKPATK